MGMEMCERIEPSIKVKKYKDFIRRKKHAYLM